MYSIHKGICHRDREYKEQNQIVFTSLSQGNLMLPTFKSTRWILWLFGTSGTGV